MTGKALNHPEPDVLSAFGLGKLPAERAREIEAHIAHCDPCCETLLDLKSDTFVDLVRSSNVDGTNRADTDARQDNSSSPGRHNQAGHPDVPPELANHPRYRTAELLGRGGMGNVYKAEHRLMNRLVAVKVINQDVLAKPTVVERFRREVQAAAQLSHANIVTAYDAEQAGDAHFLVMEYVDGNDLAALVKRQGRLSVEVACDFIGQAASGLQHAHECGMVHRDIKPHNLMVTPDGQVKILDFGLAAIAADVELDASCGLEPNPSSCSSISLDPDFTSPEYRLTNFGCMMGTPDFVSPEQATDAHAVDTRSDIYSLGCTLYFLLAGNPPFPGGSAAEKLAAHSQRDPQPIELVRNDIPPPLAEIVKRSMAKDPAVRFQTSADMAAAIKPFAAVQPSPTCDPGSPSRRNRFARWVSASIAAAAMLVLAAVFVVHLGETTVRFDIDAENLVVHFVNNEITSINDGQKIRIEPGEQQSFVVARADGTEILGRSFQLTKGQKAVLRVSIMPDDLIRVDVNDIDLVLAENPPPAKFRRVAKSGDTRRPERSASATNDKVNPNINASKEYPGVFHSPSADETPPVFRSVVQLEIVIKRGDNEAQTVYADGTVVSPDGLIATVLDVPGANQHPRGGIESAAALMLAGNSVVADIVAYHPAYGVAILRVEGLGLPHLPLAKTRLVNNQRVSWHAVYQDGRRTYLYTRPLRIHQSAHTVGETTDLCQIIDTGTSALSVERSGSALVAHDGSLVALMGRQRHWDVTPKNAPPRKKLAWGVPAEVIARLIETGS